MARVDRETASKLRSMGMKDAARIALEDARERECVAAEMRKALELFHNPPDFWTEPSYFETNNNP